MRRIVALVGTCAFVALSLSPTVVRAAEGDPSAAAPGAPAPRMEDTSASEQSLSLMGTTVWSGLEGKRVSVSLNNGNVVSGQVVAQDQANIALARAPDGIVVAVPKSEIAGVRMFDARAANGAAPISQRPRDSGRNQYVGGAVLLGFGIPIGIAGTGMLVACVGCFYIHLPLLLPGIGMMIGGSRMMKLAKAKQKKFRQAWGIPLATRMQVTPTLALGRGGGELGFTLRF